jgi:uncharacterized protein YegP (UPF0339 family)
MPAAVEFYERKDEKFDWRFKAANGEVICGSDQGYTEHGDAVEGFMRMVAEILKGGWETRFADDY